MSEKCGKNFVNNRGNKVWRFKSNKLSIYLKSREHSKPFKELFDCDAYKENEHNLVSIEEHGDIEAFENQTLRRKNRQSTAFIFQSKDVLNVKSPILKIFHFGSITSILLFKI